MISSSLTTTTAVTVFCGSSPGNDPAFVESAHSVGRALARAGRELVYGGGQNGLMGAVAAATLAEGGHVHGVTPRAFLPKDYASRQLATNEQETLVPSMHARKALMARLSTGFVGLCGGFGTLEEIAEMTTWTQLGIHKKPVVLLNVKGFYTPLQSFIEGAITSGFISEHNRPFLVFVNAEEGNPDFDWGEAALAAIDKWHAEGAGGGQPMEFEWADEKRESLG